MVTAVERMKNPLPGGYALYQNHPNPFNSSTIIEFSMPKRAEVNLSVYDLLGRKTEIIIQGELTSGRHRYIWNASGFPSGIYYCRIQIMDYAGTKKLIIIR